MCFRVLINVCVYVLSKYLEVYGSFLKYLWAR